MAILWVGSSDVDFDQFPMNAEVTGRWNKASSLWRYDAVRPYSPGSPAELQHHPSLPFPGGAVTSLWFKCRSARATGDQPSTVVRWVGVGKRGTTTGVFIGQGPNTRLAIVKWDGAVNTVLVEAAAGILNPIDAVYDLRISVHGAAATVALYRDGMEAIPPTVVDTTLAGLTGFDCVMLGRSTQTYGHDLGSFIVAEEDTRLFHEVVELRPNGAGTTNTWDAGTYADVQEADQVANDTSTAVSNVAARDFQTALTDIPAGTFRPIAVKVAARVTRTAGSTPTSLALGVNSGGTVAPGAAQALTPQMWAHIQSGILGVNPVTSQPWTVAELTALQLNLRTS